MIINIRFSILLLCPVRQILSKEYSTRDNKIASRIYPNDSFRYGRWREKSRRDEFRCGVSLRVSATTPTSQQPPTFMTHYFKKKTKETF